MSHVPLIPITALYAGLLAFLYIGLSYIVIRGRWKFAIPLGSGRNAGFERNIRGHGNFAEYVPMALLLIAFAEVNGYPAPVIHGLGMALLAGRLSHAWWFVVTAKNLRPRVLGTALTLVTIITGAALAITTAVVA